MYLLEVEKKPGELQEMPSRLSNRVIVKILYGVVTVVPMRTPIQSTLGLRNKPDQSGDLFCYFKTVFVTFYG